MITRRKFSILASGIGTSGLGAAGLLAGGDAHSAVPIHANDVLRMPDESEPHSRTWMGFGASEDIWGKTLVARCAQKFGFDCQHHREIRTRVNAGQSQRDGHRQRFDGQRRHIG